MVSSQTRINHQFIHDPIRHYTTSNGSSPQSLQYLPDVSQTVSVQMISCSRRHAPGYATVATSFCQRSRKHRSSALEMEMTPTVSSHSTTPCNWVIATSTAVQHIRNWLARYDYRPQRRMDGGIARPLVYRIVCSSLMATLPDKRVNP